MNYADLSDEALIEMICTQVMEWEIREWPGTEANDKFYGVPKIIENGEMGFDVKSRCDKWNPLTNWNDTMEVVEKMRKPINILLHENITSVIWWEGDLFSKKDQDKKEIVAKDPQRAILLAALQATND